MSLYADFAANKGALALGLPPPVSVPRATALMRLALPKTFHAIAAPRRGLTAMPHVANEGREQPGNQETHSGALGPISALSGIKGPTGMYS